MSAYLIRDKVNITLQALNKAIIADFIKLSEQGIMFKDEVLVVTKSLKGLGSIYRA